MLHRYHLENRWRRSGRVGRLGFISETSYRNISQIFYYFHITVLLSLSYPDVRIWDKILRTENERNTSLFWYLILGFLKLLSVLHSWDYELLLIFAMFSRFNIEEYFWIMLSIGKLLKGELNIVLESLSIFKVMCETQLYFA